MKKFVLVVVSLLSPLCALADDASPDAAFYQHAGAAGLAEVAGGELAQKHAKRPAVISFGQMMVRDHSAANTTLKGLALTNHAEFPTAPSAEDAAKLADLQKLTGDEFDKAYLEWQILSHKDAVALFGEESASGDDIDAKNFATSTLPTLKSHLKVLMAMPAVVTAAPAP